MSNDLKFCGPCGVGDLLGVLEKSAGIRLRDRMSLSSATYIRVSPMSVGVIIKEARRKSPRGGYNWYRMVFQDYSEEHLVVGWVCANTSGLCLELLRRS